MCSLPRVSTGAHHTLIVSPQPFCFSDFFFLRRLMDLRFVFLLPQPLLAFRARLGVLRESAAGSWGNRPERKSAPGFDNY